MRNWLDLVELEVRELLTKYEFPGDDLPVVRVSALGALNGEEKWEKGVLELMDAVDNLHCPCRCGTSSIAFLMRWKTFSRSRDAGPVVGAGRIERGICKVGEEMEIVGFRDTPQDGSDGRGDVQEAAGPGAGGDNVGLLLRGIDKEDVERGQVIAKPGSITPHKKFGQRLSC